MHWPGALSAGLPARYGSHADADTPTGLPEALASKVEPILADTRGLLLFQEQFSRIAREVVGMADESLYRFRAALTIGGPTQRLAEFRRTFNELLAAKGYSSHQSDAMWEFMGANAPSTFSKSHALAEALLIHVLAAEPLQPVAQDQ